MIAIQEAIGQALAHFRLAQHQRVEQICQQVLQIDPHQADAWHLLGLLAYRTGNYQAAAGCLRRAVALSPQAPSFQCNLGLTYQALGDLNAAVACYDRALQLQPDLPEAHDNLGLALQKQGKPEQAVACYRRALELKPDFAGALNNLSGALQDLGQLDEAVACCRRALEVQPDFAAAHNNLGVALHAMGQLPEAVLCYRRAVELQPDLAEAYHNLASTLRQQGQVDEAIACSRQALAQKPDYAAACNNLGGMLREQGKLDEAVLCFRRALACHSDCVEALNNLGAALRDQGRLEEAIATCTRAVELQPNSCEAHNNLGTALQEQGLLAEAAASYRRALAVKPGFVPAHTNLGHLLIAQGAVEDGIDQFDQALRLEPDSAVAHYGLATSVRQQPDRPDLARLKSLLADPRRTLEDRSLLGFALAHLLDKAAAYDEAFAYSQQANACKRRYYQERGLAFDVASHTALVDRLIATSTPEFFQRVAAFGVDSELPVFVVGMPRSGTTLVEQILASHQDVFGAGELEDIGQMTATLPARWSTTQGFPECLSQATPHQVRSLAEAHLRRLGTLGGKAARVIDKTTANSLHLGWIATLFPRARVIVCRRDPRDVCLSCYLLNFVNAGLNYTFDLNDLAAYYQQHERIMAHWRAILPLATFEVSYEELVRDQAGVTRNLVDFCGLDWDPRCLAFHENPRSITTASVWQVRQPIYHRSIGRWRNYHGHLQPLLDALGLPG